MNKTCEIIVLIMLLLGLWGSGVEGQPVSGQPIARLGKGIAWQVAYSPDGTLLVVLFVSS
jgi:hypothetical protein